MQNLKKSIIISFLALAALVSRSQDPQAIRNYINTYKDLAIQEMQRTGVPAAIKLAQGIHETMAGTSDLVLKSNNHFGIKCKNTWTGESVNHDDDLRGECFRKYATAEESYKDHSNFLKDNTRYAFLFNLDPTDYAGWARGLKKAGYATNPSYSQIIIKIIEDYHLEDYTLIAMGKKENTDDAIAKLSDSSPQPQQETVQTKTPENEAQALPLMAAVKEPETVAKNEVIKEESVWTAPKQPEKKIIHADYPEGEFQINETRVVYVKKGVSFLALAQQYNVPLARIFEFNDMPVTESLASDQLIYLQRKRKTGNNEFHIVQPGETLHDIAQTEAIRLETLQEYNLLGNDARPAIGEQLYLRTKAPAMPKLVLKENYSLYDADTKSVWATTTPAGLVKPGLTDTNIPVNGNFMSYTVQSRETIYSIAKRYHVKIDDIVKWNHLSGYDLKEGEELKIYK